MLHGTEELRTQVQGMFFNGYVAVFLGSNACHWGEGGLGTKVLLGPWMGAGENGKSGSPWSCFFHIQILTLSLQGDPCLSCCFPEHFCLCCYYPKKVGLQDFLKSHQTKENLVYNKSLVLLTDGSPLLQCLFN